MSAYHTKFSYLGHDNIEYNLCVASFEPDNGFKDSFLSMDSVYDDSYNGYKRYSYGTKYNSVANISITLIKNDYEDITVNEMRNLLKWLTGSHKDSWLDLYVSDEIQYSFLGTVTDVQQYKLDSRSIGIMLNFTSVSPWAYSQLIKLDEPFTFDSMKVNTDGVLCVPDDRFVVSILDDGTIDNSMNFKYLDDGIVTVDQRGRHIENNLTDDIYSYIYVDLKLINDDATNIQIDNTSTNEIIKLKNMQKGEVINISSNQFIVSDVPDKLFYDDFNFVFPRLQPGDNIIFIDADGKGTMEFSYRYPIKIGDCTINIEEVIC